MKTYNDLITLVSDLNQVVFDNGSKRELKIKKIVGKINPLLAVYNEKREDIKLEHAYTDSNGLLEFNEKGEYKYTKEGFRAINNDFKELLNQSFDFEVIEIGTDGIEDLVFLSGWVKGI